MSNWWETDNKWDSTADDTWKADTWSSNVAEEVDPWAQTNTNTATDTAEASNDAWNTTQAADNSWGESWDTKAEGTTAPPPDDKGANPWGESSWGGDNNKSWVDASAAAPTPNAKAFWEAQEWNKQSGTGPKKQDWELDQNDTAFFVERLGSNAVVSSYQHVPVDVTGNKSSMIPVCESFEEIYSQFKELIPDALVENVRRCQYTQPTPVQKYSIPVGLCGRDVMCCAQTGSGKTAAFLFPIIGRMMEHHKNPVGAMDVPFEGKCTPDTLIMTPTRELCIQIHEEAEKFCHRSDYRTCRVYGGEPPKVQMEQLAKGCDLMVACPGRLADFIGREIIDVSKVYILVLDEADRMLDMGFEKAIREIVCEHGMPEKEQRQTMMFSATFPEECQKMAQDFLYDYIWIGVGIVGGACEQVAQTLEQVKVADKYTRLMEILDSWYARRENKSRCLVFVNAKDTAKWLDEQLYDKHIDTGALHGNLTQEERERNLKRFRSGEIDVMVATDVAARGLDIEQVGLVLNYDFPNEIDTYIHRIGRTGRIGNTGEAISFVSVDDYGAVLEKPEVLKRLDAIMRDSRSAVPDWLEGAIGGVQDTWASNNDSNDTWKNWGGKDMRSQW